MQDFSIHRAQAFSWTEEESKIVNKHTSKNLIIMHATFLEKQKFKNHNLSFKVPPPISFLFQYNSWIILKTVQISIYLFTNDCIYGKVKAYRPARNLKPSKTKSMLNTKRWESERGWQCAEMENRKRMLHEKGTQNWFLGRGRFWVKLHWNPCYSQSQVGNSYLLDSNPLWAVRITRLSCLFGLLNASSATEKPFGLGSFYLSSFTSVAYAFLF